jgi:hypothetical protein
MLNPLLVKEIRIQTRGWETYAIGTIYILALSALVFSLFWEAAGDKRGMEPGHGEEMFLAFAVVLILAITLICPALTVGAISSEREKLTFEQLRVTLLRPHQILIGKAGPPIIYAIVLLLASTPIVSFILLSDGISLEKVAYSYLIAFTSAMAFSLSGLMCSSVYRTTRLSTVMTYAIVGLFTFGTAMLPMIASNVFRLKINRVILDFSIALNPFHAVFSIFGKGRQLQLYGLSPWTVAILGYMVVSVLAICVALFRFKTMRD